MPPPAPAFFAAAAARSWLTDPAQIAAHLASLSAAEGDADLVHGERTSPVQLALLEGGLLARPRGGAPAPSAPEGATVELQYAAAGRRCAFRAGVAARRAEGLVIELPSVISAVEARQHRRLSLQSEGFLFLPEGHSPMPVLDLSEGGARLAVPTPPPPGTLLRGALQLTGPPIAPMLLLVEWSAPVHAHAVAGLRFIGLAEVQAQQLRAFLGPRLDAPGASALRA
jgi:hypothetical protein